MYISPFKNSTSVIWRGNAAVGHKYFDSWEKDSMDPCGVFTPAFWYILRLSDISLKSVYFDSNCKFVDTLSSHPHLLLLNISFQLS